MSITASYVVLAVLLIRLLLKKAPKKYAYALWSVVGFRLCCPVSFQSVFSIFSLKFFDMSKAQQDSAATLQYVPANIGMMAQPEITVGIPYANTAITGSLPAATPMYSANPMQIWTMVGACLWCIGVIGLLLYSIISYVWLHYKMRNAVILEKNVFQSDKIRSPFMLGVIRPKIYIPFDLEEQARRYVLTHERYHLKRKDHIIKLVAFLLLTIHWFNPLCWLAFILMGRDMEMSCDEKVLAGEENIRKSYSTTLLSFAANRRFPAPSPLAFGENGVKMRIKNILNWKKPTYLITAVAVLLCAIVLIACAANPVETAENNSASDIAGGISAETAENNSVSDMAGEISAEKETIYVSTECLYMNMLSSVFTNGDSGYKYVMREDSFTIVSKATGGVVSETTNMDWDWQPFPYTQEEWTELLYPVELSGVETDKRQLADYEETLYLELANRYCLLKMDGQLWIMRTGEHPNHAEFVWEIYLLEPADESVVNTVQAIEPGKQGGDTQEISETIDAEVPENMLEAAIHRAILENNQSPYREDYFECESHLILGTREYSRFSEELQSAVNCVDVYAMVLWKLYDYQEETGLADEGGSSGPVRLSFDIDERGQYILTNFWRPRDGSFYKPDIEKIFGELSEEAVNDALDTQQYIYAQHQNSYAQAVAYFEIDTNGEVERLLENLMMIAPWASAPQEVYDSWEIDVAYRELLYYGDYTLQYIFREFLKGGQTDLKGYWMRILMMDLLGEEAVELEAATGQEYFDLWLEQAEKTAAEVGLENMRETHPKTYMLLQMTEAGK